MIEIPPGLVAHRAQLQKLLDGFTSDIGEREQSLKAMNQNRDMVLSEIRGIDVAVAAYNGAVLLTQRAPRRDIKALAEAEIAQTPGWSGMSRDERIRYLCKQLRCKPSQIEAAIDLKSETKSALEGVAKRDGQLQFGPGLHSGPNLAGSGTILGG